MWGRIIHTNPHGGGRGIQDLSASSRPCLFSGCLYSVQSVHLLCSSTPRGFQIKCPIPTCYTENTLFIGHNFLESAIVSVYSPKAEITVPIASSRASTALAVNCHAPACVTGRDGGVEAEAKRGENPILEKIAINLASM